MKHQGKGRRLPGIEDQIVACEPKTCFRTRCAIGQKYSAYQAMKRLALAEPSAFVARPDKIVGFM